MPRLAILRRSSTSSRWSRPKIWECAPRSWRRSRSSATRTFSERSCSARKCATSGARKCASSRARRTSARSAAAASRATTTRRRRRRRSSTLASRRILRGGYSMASDFPRHLLDLESLTRPQIEALLTLASRFKHERAAARSGEKAVDRRGMLRGRTVITLFFENSTRTRSSFEVAARSLGADVLSFQKEASSVAKGESLEDTVRNLDAIGADALVVRHPAAGAPRLGARSVRACVINAGDGEHEHPTQGLLDALSLRERWGTLEGKTVAIVGDVAHSRVARSNIHCLSKLGARVRVGGPSTLIPTGIEKLGCTVAGTLKEALTGADAVMALRIQNERIADARLAAARDYARTWGINLRTLEFLPRDALVLHPGPVNRGVEMSSDVLEGPRSLVMDQVDSGVAVRMAALALCLRAEVAAVEGGLDP